MVFTKEWYKTHEHPKGFLGKTAWNKNKHTGIKPMLGKVPWSKGLTKETDERIKQRANKQSETNKRLFREGKLKINTNGLKLGSGWNRGYGDYMKGEKNPMWGKKRPDTSELMKTTEIRKKILKNLMKRPTKPEQKLVEIIQKNNLPFVYTGNGSVIIESLNPDFIDNNGSKKIIEVFGDFWHKPSENHRRLKLSDTEEGRKEIYSKYGFKTLIFWEHEIKKLSEKDIIDKIINFGG